mmetsp:Transcript_2746/g.4308  ORF Transcript_2746/g.4308 Transcript_2746/m.4308 type:complete len:123 (+) Transcript_2746:2417-2785(+)
MNTKGIGLGLVISRMISHEFGGTAQMFSKSGHGSVFLSSFRLLKTEDGNEELASSFDREMASTITYGQLLAKVEGAKKQTYVKLFISAYEKRQWHLSVKNYKLFQATSSSDGDNRVQKSPIA